MENDKPSNPQQQGADSNDLIDEMSRLLSQENNSPQPAPTPAAPRSPALSGDQRAPAPAADDSKGWLPSAKTATPKPTSPAPANPAPLSAAPKPTAQPEPTPTFGLRPQTAPAPTSAPSTPSVATPAPSAQGSAGDSVPSWMPQPDAPSKPGAAEKPAAPRIDFGNLDLGLEKPASTPTPATAGLSAPKPAAPQPVAPPPVTPAPLAPEPVAASLTPAPVSAPPPVAAPIVQPQAPAAPAPTDFSFDLGLGDSSTSDSGNQGDAGQPAKPAPQPVASAPAPQSSVPVEEDDPIAELIRAQLSSAPNEQPIEGNLGDDRFSVAPVMGLGGTVAAKTQAGTTSKNSGSQALDDIESLIGDAVRLESDDASARSAVEGPRPMPKPTATSRGAQTSEFQQPVPVPPAQSAPRPAAIEIEDNVSAAEAAIMAAMQPAQSPNVQADSNFSASDQQSTKKGGAAALGSINWARAAVPVAAILLLGVIGFAGYNLFAGSFGESGDTPLVVASTGDTKQDPEPSTNPTADASVVLDGSTTSPDSEQLVSRDQSGDADDPIRQIITADTTENGLANRKVRTVTVRPDGTIIQGDDQVAAGETLATDRPNVPELPANATNSELADTTVASLTTDAASAAQTAANLVAVNGSSVPFPLPRMTDRETRLATATAVVQQVAATQPAVTNVVSTTPVTSSAAWVQLASQRSQSAADDTVAQLTGQYGSFFNGQALQVQRADLGDRGVFYRIMLPASSLTDATNICTRIQTAGGNCFPRSN